MDIYTQLNLVIKYIEENLDNEISYKKIAQIIGSNEYVTQRLFLLITNISISEYIRCRRLSKAASDLVKEKSKVIDIAMKYQYNSPISFARAFKKFHGINPSEIKNERKIFTSYPIIKFKDTARIYQNSKYRVVKDKKIILFGIKESAQIKNIQNIAPVLWKKVKKEILAFKQAKKSYGLVEYHSDMKYANYYVALEKEFLGSEKIIIPGALWLVVETKLKKAKDISQKSDEISSELIPSAGYKTNYKIEMEIYHDDILEMWYIIS